MSRSPVGSRLREPRLWLEKEKSASYFGRSQAPRHQTLGIEVQPALIARADRGIEQSPLIGVKRKLEMRMLESEKDPACVKTSVSDPQWIYSASYQHPRPKVAFRGAHPN